MHIEDLIIRFGYYFLLGLLLGGVAAFAYHRISGARLRYWIRRITRRAEPGVFVRPYTVKLNK